MKEARGKKEEARTVRVSKRGSNGFLSGIWIRIAVRMRRENGG
jgi:hypothetical protein